MINNESSFTTWMHIVSSVARTHCLHDGIYAGTEGCRRFARECAPALLDFADERHAPESFLGSTYSGICVIAYNLKPPVDAKDWLKWMRESLEEAKQNDKRYS